MVNQLISEMSHHNEHFKSFSFALNLEKEKMRISPFDAQVKRFAFKGVKIYDAHVINPFGEFPENVSDVTYKLNLLGAPAIDLKSFEKEFENV